jgi:hypothetical protein
MVEEVIIQKTTVKDLVELIRMAIREELKKDQFITKAQALRMADINRGTLLRYIKAGKVTPQVVKGKSDPMYLESEILKLEKGKHK